MRRIYIILIMLLSVAAASAQLHGKLGRELQEQCNKGNIERIQASDEALEIQEEYKELIRKVATRNLSKKYSDREALQMMLDCIDSVKITIWEPRTTKGYKILHKQAKRLAMRKKRSMATELILWKSGIFSRLTKSCRIQKYLGVYGDDTAVTDLSSTVTNNTVTQLLVTTTTKDKENKETLYVLCYTGRRLIYWSNK
ncbi:MAG: hypothetical protein IKV23_01045 [Bacteroidaceae bacterium]|nr:hypothetical protein [Bacteroidaceae bacterium]